MTPDPNKRRLSLRELLGVVTYAAVTMGLGGWGRFVTAFGITGGMMLVAGAGCVVGFVLDGRRGAKIGFVLAGAVAWFAVALGLMRTGSVFVGAPMLAFGCSVVLGFFIGGRERALQMGIVIFVVLGIPILTFLFGLALMRGA